MAIYVNKELAQKFLGTPSEDKWFHIPNRTSLKNIYDLKDFMSEINEDDYKKYVTKEKNDFRSWVEGVFQNSRLAEGLDKARTPSEAKLYLQRNITMLERNVNRP